MSLSSRNPGHWRTSRTGSLNAHHMTVATTNSGRPVDGKLELSEVTDNSAKNRRKRHVQKPLGKNARKRANRRFGKAAA